MNTMRRPLLVAAIILMGITACNYTVGECWPRGEGGGTGSESVAAGGGIIIPTGVGGFGDAPPKQPQDATDPELKCNSDDTDDTDTEGSTESPTTESPCTAAESEAAFWTCGDADTCSLKCATGGVNAGPFSPVIFKFVTIVADDGKGTAGGWQEASANLRIIRLNYFVIPETWYCPLTIGMPLRTTLNGPISPDYAATLTAKVANQAARIIKKGSSDLPQGIFCIKLKSEITGIFSSQYKSYGVSVK